MPLKPAVEWAAAAARSGAEATAGMSRRWARRAGSGSEAEVQLTRAQLRLGSSSRQPSVAGKPVSKLDQARPRVGRCARVSARAPDVTTGGEPLRRPPSSRSRQSYRAQGPRLGEGAHRRAGLKLTRGGQSSTALQILVRIGPVSMRSSAQQGSPSPPSELTRIRDAWPDPAF